MDMPNITRLYLVGCAFALTACNSNAPIDFERMSAGELMAHNRTVEFWDQVYCADEVRAGSHIRRRHCETLIEIKERVANSAEAINVIGSSRIF